jgi:hypothetical protein
MGFDPRQRRADDEAMLAKQLGVPVDETKLPIIDLDAAGDVVSKLVSANKNIVLGSTQLGRYRQRDSRNALSESMFTHYQLVSMLAVAIDRLAVWESMTPTVAKERLEKIISDKVHGYTGIRMHRDQARDIAQAVIDK